MRMPIKAQIAKDALLALLDEPTNEEREVIREVTGIITSNLDINEVYRRFAEEVGKLVASDEATITIVDESNGIATIAYLSPQTGSGLDQGETFPLEGTVSGLLAQTRRSLVLGDIADDPQTWKSQHHLKDGLRSLIAVPLISKERVIGTFSLNSRLPDAYCARDQDILERLAPPIALAMENSLLFQEVTRLVLALESIGDAVVFVDVGGNIQFMNRAAQEMFGYSRGVILGKSCAFFFPPDPDSQAHCHQLLQEALEGGWRGEVMGVTKEAVEFDMYATVTPVKDQEGGLIGAVYTAQDITERKRTQRMSTALVVKAKEIETLQRVDQLRKDLIATVSHEFSTPLASIKGYISTLLQSDVKWEPQLQREFLAIANQEADRLNRLVGDLLTVSQLEAGVLNLEREWIGVAAILKAGESQIGPLVSSHSLHMAIPADLPPVLVDKHRVIQVISNLVSNAAKFSETGTRITMGATLRGDQVVVRVSDEGRGIPNDQLDRVFEPFYKRERNPQRPTRPRVRAFLQEGEESPTTN